MKISQQQCTHAYKNVSQKVAIICSLSKWKAASKVCFLGVCPRQDTFITDDLEDPLENKLIKSEDNIKP